MTTRRLVEVVFRIWGLWLLVRAITAAPALVGLLTRSSQSPVDADMLYNLRLTTVAMIVLQLLLAAAMFQMAPRLAAWVVVGDDEPVSISVDTKGLMKVALSVLGVTAVCEGLIEIAPALYTWWSMRSDPSSTVSLVVSRRWESIARGLIEIVIGVVLFSGLDALIRRWRIIRSLEP